jgi:hypothetical protein
VEHIRTFSIAAIALLATGSLATATEIFDTSSPGVMYAVSDGSFWVRSTQITPSGTPPGKDATAYVDAVNSNFVLSADGTGYSDAGIVLYFNGGFALGDLASVTTTSTGNPLSINLWLDTGGDGNFFTFNPDGSLVGINGDSYGGTGSGAVNAGSVFYMFGGNGAGGSYTLAQLQSGVVPGIGATTLTSLWVGITNTHTASISEIDVNFIPEPGTFVLLGAGLLVCGLARRRITSPAR